MVSVQGNVLGEQVGGHLESEGSTWVAFKGLVGQLFFGDRGSADVRVSQPGTGWPPGYSVQLTDPTRLWSVELRSQVSSVDRAVDVEVLLNGESVVSASTRHVRWTEVVISLGGFVRHKWGYWGSPNNQPILFAPSAACLWCVAFHNSVLGDTLLSDSAIG